MARGTVFDFRERPGAENGPTGKPTMPVDLRWARLSRPPWGGGFDRRKERWAAAGASAETLSRLGLPPAGGLVSINALGRERVAWLHGLAEPRGAHACAGVHPLLPGTVYLSPLLAHNLAVADASPPTVCARALAHAELPPAAARVVLARVRTPFALAPSAAAARESARALRAHFSGASRTLGQGDLLAVRSRAPRIDAREDGDSDDDDDSDDDRDELGDDRARRGSDAQSCAGVGAANGDESAWRVRAPVQWQLYVVTRIDPGAHAAAGGDGGGRWGSGDGGATPGARLVGASDTSLTVAVGETTLLEHGSAQSALPPGLARYLRALGGDGEARAAAEGSLPSALEPALSALCEHLSLIHI